MVTRESFRNRSKLKKKRKQALFDSHNKQRSWVKQLVDSLHLGILLSIDKSVRNQQGGQFM